MISNQQANCEHPLSSFVISNPDISLPKAESTTSWRSSKAFTTTSGSSAKAIIVSMPLIENKKSTMFSFKQVYLLP